MTRGRHREKHKKHDPKTGGEEKEWGGKEAFGRTGFNVGGSVWDLWRDLPQVSSSGGGSSELLRGKDSLLLCLNEP